MRFRQTKHQVARGARPDFEDHIRLILIKRPSELRATYQIRLLAYRAQTEGKRLIIEVPKACRIRRDLREFAKENAKVVRIERMK